MTNDVEHEPHEGEPEWPEQMVSCRECFREVPKTEAVVSEAQDYVLYFCGIECYGAWREKAGDAE